MTIPASCGISNPRVFCASQLEMQEQLRDMAVDQTCVSQSREMVCYCANESRLSAFGTEVVEQVCGVSHRERSHHCASPRPANFHGQDEHDTDGAMRLDAGSMSRER